MSQWRSKQIAALGKWTGINAIFFMVFNLFLHPNIASSLSFIIVFLAIMHPDNKKDRDAVKLPVIDIILEK